MKIAILMLTYNAPQYVYKAITSLKKTDKTISYELVVVDNASKAPTRWLLKFLKKCGYIDLLFFNDYNALFAKGNNIASSLVSDDVTHYLLLNSDVEIKNANWLNRLCQIHSSEGISAFGAVNSEPLRADGYCMLIDRWLYDKFKLDESFEWWWSVTKLESQVLKEGFLIRAVKNHEDYLHHFGGASGKGWVDAKGMDLGVGEINSWFVNKKNEVIFIEKA